MCKPRPTEDKKCSCTQLGKVAAESCGEANVRACSRYCPSVFEWLPQPLQVCVRAKGGYCDMEEGRRGGRRDKRDL